MYIDDYEKDMFLKLVGVASTLNLIANFHSVDVEFNDSNGCQIIKTMTKDDIDMLLEKCWNELQ